MLFIAHFVVTYNLARVTDYSVCPALLNFSVCVLITLISWRCGKAAFRVLAPSWPGARDCHVSTQTDRRRQTYRHIDRF